MRVLTQTLRILHRMCNSQNVDIIVKRFLLALSSTYDQFQRQSLIDRICEVAERSFFLPPLTQIRAEPLLVHQHDDVGLRLRRPPGEAVGGDDADQDAFGEPG